MSPVQEINYHFCDFGCITHKRVFFYPLHNKSCQIEKISAVNIVRRAPRKYLPIVLLLAIALPLAHLPLLLGGVVFLIWGFVFIRSKQYQFMFKIELSDGSQWSFPIKKDQYRKALLFQRKINIYSKTYAF